MEGVYEMIPVCSTSVLICKYAFHSFHDKSDVSVFEFYVKGPCSSKFSFICKFRF